MLSAGTLDVIEINSQPDQEQHANSKEDDLAIEEKPAVKSNVTQVALLNPVRVARRALNTNSVVNVNTSKAQKEALKAVTNAIKAGKEAKAMKSKTTANTVQNSPRNGEDASQSEQMLKVFKHVEESKTNVQSRHNSKDRLIAHAEPLLYPKENIPKRNEVFIAEKQAERAKLATREKIKQKNVVKKFAFATRIGFNPNNPDKVNQDSFILAPNIQDQPALHLFGVCDGHGTYGRDSSTFVKFALQMDLEQRLEKDYSKEFLNKAFSESFKTVHEAFGTNVPKPEYSGTTCCSVLLNGHKIITANAGDSRAILVDKYRKITELTTDNKPDQPEEKKRILSKGGRV